MHYQTYQFYHPFNTSSPKKSSLLVLQSFLSLKKKMKVEKGKKINLFIVCAINVSKVIVLSIQQSTVSIL